jgi:hypothetical protein
MSSADARTLQPRYEARNVQEAVDLAFSLQQQGLYRWFRGQVKEWVPRSSMHRLVQAGDATAVARNMRRIKMVREWLATVPQLHYLLEPARWHELMAVLQHYGVATPYLDFTTDPGVAGFFAAHSETPLTDGNACIFCLDPEDLIELWRSMRSAGGRQNTELETVQVDVTNLWRLQSQAGVFVYSNYNWDLDYDLDCIVFPHSGYPSVPTVDRIYPPQKSALEQLLDQYFEIERMTFAHERLLRETEERQKAGRPHFRMIEMQPHAEGLNPEAFRNASLLSPLPSWESSRLQPWHTHAQERFHTTVGKMLRLRLDVDASPDHVRAAIAFGVRQNLRTDEKLRSQAVDWIVETSSASSLPVATLNEFLQCAWNGMRQLPYLDEDLSTALGNVAMLVAAGYHTLSDFEPQRACLTRHFGGEVIDVGFSASDGSGSAGWVPVRDLKKALRSDLPRLLEKRNAGAVDHLRGLFSMIYKPSLMFEFAAFSQVFATYAIPTQIVSRRPLVLFNPAALMLFGNR